jgi:hypothetical protein
MASQADAFLAEWHRIVAEKDAAAVIRLLAAEVTIGAPPYWNRMQGAPLVAHLLGLILETIEDFTYHREWTQGDELALEFSGRVGDTQLQGIDLISLDARGRIRGLDVLMRPVNAVVALRERIAPRMVEYLAARAREAEV